MGDPHDCGNLHDAELVTPPTTLQHGNQRLATIFLGGYHLPNSRDTEVPCEIFSLGKSHPIPCLLGGLEHSFHFSIYWEYLIIPTPSLFHVGWRFKPPTSNNNPINFPIQTMFPETSHRNPIKIPGNPIGLLFHEVT